MKDLINSREVDYKLIFFFFIFTRIYAIILTFPTVTDVWVYLNYFRNLYLDQLTPYLEFNFEYPPLTIVPIYFSGIFLEKINFDSYFLFFACVMFFADFTCLKICQKYCKERLAMNEADIKYMMLIYTIFGLLLFRILYHRLDVIVALLFTSSLLLFSAKNKKLSLGFILNAVIGFFYKIVPAFLVPSAIILKSSLSSNNKREFTIKTFKHCLAFLLMLIILILIIESLVGFTFTKNLLFHQARGIQIESLYGSLLLFTNLAFGSKFLVQFGYGSFNVISENIYLELFSKYIGHIVLLLFYLSIFIILAKKYNKPSKIKISDELFLEIALITILLVFCFQRVLSTQFFIWLIPVASIYLARNRSIKNFLILILLFFGTHIIFSLDYIALLNQEPILVSTLFLRNLLMLYFTISLTHTFFKKLSS